MPPPTLQRPANRKPVQRLASIRNPTPARRMQPTSAKQSRSTTCPNPNCPAPNIVDDDDKKVCSGCGTVISESNIVAEVTFGETSSGAAVVQGTYVGADQSHGRNFGPGFKRGGLESREVTESNGRRYINQLARALRIPQTISDAGFQIFKLAVGANFIQGRRTRNVAAVCLYIACRRQDSNQVMLIDFSDVLHVNVFKLGTTYKALLDELRLGGTTFLVNPVNPEDLIFRFAKQLEFGSSTMQVANEAAHIVQRMNRDWMTTGRRPGGICGAALILAARMNNFRRTVRELVYVVKVTDITIHQRLDEFARTESSDLTVEQFRTIDLEKAHDPPAFYKAKVEKKNRRRKRKAPENAEEIEGDGGEEDLNPRPVQRRRIDADGFAIPDLPIDPALTAGETIDVEIDPSLTSAVNTALSELEVGPTPPSSLPAVSTVNTGAAAEEVISSKKPAKPKPPPKRRGRKPKVHTQSSPIDPEELAFETALESEMTDILSQNNPLLPTPTDDPNMDSARNPANSTTTNAVISRFGEIPTTETISDSEFADDPEINNCILTPAEVEIKERLWVHENRDYLRQQQAKLLKRQLEEESGTGRIIKRRKRKKGRMGDVTYIHGEEGASGEGSRASTPAEATRMMLEKRGFSKKINYRLLESLFEDDIESSGGRGDDESGSRSGTPPSATPTPTRRESFILPDPPSRTRRQPEMLSRDKAGSSPSSAAQKVSVITPPSSKLTPTASPRPKPHASASTATAISPLTRHLVSGPIADPDDFSEEEAEEEIARSSMQATDDEATIRNAFAGNIPPPLPENIDEMEDDEDEDDDEEDDLAEQGEEIDYYDVGSGDED